MKDVNNLKAVIPTVDFHCHILPGMDDGSSSVAESLELLKESYRQGVRKQVLTSHFYPDRETPEHFLTRRAVALANLTDALKVHPIERPRLCLGAEVAYFPGIGKCESISKLTVEGTRVLLLEMPFCKWDEEILQDVRLLKEQEDLTLMIAHIERYGRVNRKHWKTLLNMGCLIQSNGTFFYHDRINRKAIRLIRHGKIHFFGSDCHNTDRRPPNLGNASNGIASLLGEDFCRMMYDLGNRVLSGASEY